MESGLAQIRVNGVEIDGGRITIDGKVVVGESPKRPSSSNTPAEPANQASLGALPWAKMTSTHALALAGVGGLLFVAGGAAWFLVPLRGIARFVIGGGAVAFLGLGLIIVSFIRRAQIRAKLVADRDAVSADRAADIESGRQAIVHQLAEASTPQTLEEIVEDTEVCLEIAVYALRSLVDEARVEEDLNLQTGDWVYAARKAQVQPGRLDEHIRRLENP
jgi:hypothetical protein